MNEEQLQQALRTALTLLWDADAYLTDGDELEEIEAEGAPDVAEWAQQVRALIEQHQALLE